MLSNIFKVIVITMIVMNASSCNAADRPRETAKPDAAVYAAPPAAEAGKSALPPQKPAAENVHAAYDFTDSSSWNLTVSAWEHLAAKDYAGAVAYAQKCLALYEAQAIETARSMTRFASPGREDEYTIVNDVATAHYIMGEAYMKEARYDEAVKEFDLIIARYPFSQCWDPKGWFWKIAEVSRKNLDKIEKLKTVK